MNKHLSNFNVHLPFGGVWNPELGIVPIPPFITNCLHETSGIVKEELTNRIIFISGIQLPNSIFLFTTANGFIVEKVNNVYYSTEHSVDLVIRILHTLVEVNNERYVIPLPIDFSSQQVRNYLFPPSENGVGYTVICDNTSASFDTLEAASAYRDALSFFGAEVSIIPFVL